MKRIVVLLLVLTFVMSAFAGCKKSEEVTVNEDGVTLLAEPVVISDGASTYFSIVKPDVTDDAMVLCVSSLSKPADGINLSVSVAKESDNANTNGEILLGNTCRTQTKSVMSGIGYDDYSICYTEGKIVVAAHTPERLTDAVNFMREKLLRVNGGKLEYIGNYTFESSEALMIDDGDSIADYKIVCGNDELYMSAQKIQKYINDNLGVKLEIIYDTKPCEGKEIVLGTAKRDITSLTDDLDIGEGIIAVKDKSLLVSAKDPASTSQLVELFIETYLSGAYTDGFNFKNDFSVKVDAYSGVFADSAEFTSGADIRVMSLNVLCDLWGNEAVSGRAPTINKTILNYAPDVIGLQEMSDGWHRAIKTAMKNTPYKLICTEHEYVDDKYGNLNFTPILYNSDKLTLKDSGTREYTSALLRYMRTITWALFEVKDSKEQFIIINTHYDSPGDDEAEKAEHLEYRKKQTVDIVNFINELEATHDLPILLTGDFNTTEGNDKTDKHLPYWNIIAAGMKDAKSSADKIKRACTTWHTLGSQVSTVSPAGSFDHIFGNEKVQFKYFNTLVDKILMSATDHCPIYADVKLN